MEFSRIKSTIASPKPEVRYTRATAEELSAGGPFDAGKNRYLAVGETFETPMETAMGNFPATFDAIVKIVLDTVEGGRCAHCRDNSRVRFTVHVSDQHGIKKWCVPCLVELYGTDPNKPEP